MRLRNLRRKKRKRKSVLNEQKRVPLGALFLFSNIIYASFSGLLFFFVFDIIRIEITGLPSLRTAPFICPLSAEDAIYAHIDVLVKTLSGTGITRERQLKEKGE